MASLKFWDGSQWVEVGGGAKFATGTYVGDGTLSRKITIGFTPKFITLMSQNGGDFRQLYHIYVDNNSAVSLSPSYFGIFLDTSFTGYLISSLDSTGFYTGDSSANSSNKSGEIYYWVAIA